MTDHQAVKMKHSHSVPMKQHSHNSTPQLFRISRSNINDVVDVTTTNNTTTSSTATANNNNSSHHENNNTTTEEQVPAEVVPSWNINNDNVQLFPSYLEKERTHCIVHASSPRDVANYISTYLNNKDVAISTLYDNENAIAHVELKDELRVLIRLFKIKHNEDEGNEEENQEEHEKDDDGNDDYDHDKRGTKNKHNKKEKKNCTLVEVCRRDGCSAAFHNEAWKILHVAQKGLDMSTVTCTCKNTLETMNITTTSSLRENAKMFTIPKELRSDYLKQFKI